MSWMSTTDGPDETREASRGIIRWMILEGQPHDDVQSYWHRVGANDELAKLTGHLKRCDTNWDKTYGPTWYIDTAYGNNTVRAVAHITCRCGQVDALYMQTPDIQHPEQLAEATTRHRTKKLTTEDPHSPHAIADPNEQTSR